MITNLPKETDSKRYVGRDVELVFSDAPTAAELEQVEGWAETIYGRTCTGKVIFIQMGENAQLEELHRFVHECPAVDRDDHPLAGQPLLEYLGPLTADEFRRYNLAVPQKRKGVNRGKGQRKANRANRWR